MHLVVQVVENCIDSSFHLPTPPTHQSCTMLKHSGPFTGGLRSCVQFDSVNQASRNWEDPSQLGSSLLVPYFNNFSKTCRLYSTAFWFTSSKCQFLGLCEGNLESQFDCTCTLEVNIYPPPSQPQCYCIDMQLFSL